METINATRMNLLLKREELKDASGGRDLLRNKRDVLISEFFSTLKPLLALREALDNQADEASGGLVLALGLVGQEKLNSFSFLKHKAPSFKINYKNLLGLKIPEVIFESKSQARDFTYTDTELLILETKRDFQDFLGLILRILPEELKLKRLGQEIKATSRKVNSLEKFIIPQLRAQVKFMRQTLEEREREDVFRLKRLKKKRR